MARWNLLIFLVLIIGNNFVVSEEHVEEPSARYYLLHNGTDSPTCGSNAREACASFRYLLGVFSPKYKPVNSTALLRLQIFADMSITMDKNIVDTYPWMSGLSLSLRKFRKWNQNVSMAIDSVSLNNSFHETENIDLTIINSELTNYQLKFRGSHFAELNNIDESTSRPQTLIWNRLVITKSSLVSQGFVSSLTILEGHATLTGVQISRANQAVPIMKTVRSELVLNNCHFIRNTIDKVYLGVLSFWETEAIIINCRFENNRNLKGVGGAIHATVGSKLSISNCVFNNNSASLYAGGAIYAVHNVEVNISSSVFTNNSAFHHGGAIFSSHNATFRISNANFSGNHANLSNGGCLTMSNRTNFYIQNSTFKNNTAGKEGGAIHVDTHNILQIENTEFVNNLAKLNTGVLSVSYFSEATLKNCLFVNNTAVLTLSVISANHHVNLFIDRCVFDNNPSAFTGLLEASDDVNIIITNSNFTRNSANIGSLIEIKNSTFVVHNTHFDNNLGGSLIYGHDFGRLLFQKCQFSNHSLAADPIMVISNAYLEMNNSTFINNTQNKEGAIIIGKTNCIVNVTSCQFVGNHASKGGAFHISRESTLIVDNSTFLNNSAGDGGIAYLLDSNATFINTKVSNTFGTGYGGVMTAFNSKLTVRNSKFSSNEAVYGGCFYLKTNSSLAAFDSVFEKGKARQGGAIFKKGPGNISLENCTLGSNKGKFGGAIYALDVNYVRVAQGLCQYDAYLKRDCLTFYCSSGKHKCKLYTFNYTISNGNYTLNSRNNTNFFEDAKHRKMIFGPNKNSAWLETPFASLNPIPCGKDCRCYYRQDKGNVYNCSTTKRTFLPDDKDVPHITDWLDVSQNKLNKLCGDSPYLKNTSALFLTNNNISEICGDTLDVLKKGKLEVLTLSHNRLQRLPKDIRNITTLNEVWLSNNPFICDCNILWMRDWMESFNKSGKRVVQDYLYINCEDGFPIHALDPVVMGCFPMELTLWEKILIGVLAGVAIGIAILIVTINRRWNEIKWFMYLHFDILAKQNETENLENKESDALFSYSEDDEELMQELFMKYNRMNSILEDDHGFKVVIPERDFLLGTNILDNVEKSITKSRRMIVLLTRNYVKDNMCMEIFRLAHHNMVKENKKYLILILLEKLDLDALSRDLQMYIRTRTYIDGRDAVENPENRTRLRKRLRFEMPSTPLSKLRPPPTEDCAHNDEAEETRSVGNESQASVVEGHHCNHNNRNPQPGVCSTNDVNADPNCNERSPLLSNGPARGGMENYASVNFS